MSVGLALGPPRRVGRWSDLGKRAASALVLGPLALSCIWFGGWAFHLLVVAATIGLTFEWVQLWRAHPGCLPPGQAMPRVAAAPSALVAAAIVAAIVAAAVGEFYPALLIVAVGTGALVLLCRGRLGVPAGVPYLALGALAVIWIRDDPDAGRANLVFMLLLIWASDIGAYLAGRLIGGAKMAPRISPGKTWSGAVGGLAAAVLVGWGTALLLQPPVPPARVILLSIVLGVVAQAGDLLESWIKRQFGVKDSGWLIPGHGGLLDRVDAVLTVAPVAAALALFAGRGVVLWQ